MQPYADAERKLEIPDYADLDRPRVQRMMREYLASVRSVDRNLGRVLGELDDLNLADQTVVVYTSDHGYNMGHHGIWHKGNGIWALTHDVPPTHNVARNYRPNMFDNSIRVPTFVRWPPVVEAGQVISHTTSNLDWFPTLLAIAGIDAPQELVLRGHNLLPLLRGESPQDWDEDFFGFYSSNYESQFVEEMRMIRTPRWKLVRYLRAPERDELFQLDDDPAEEHNRISDANELRTVIEQLDRKLKFHMQRCNDPALPLR